MSSQHTLDAPVLIAGAGPIGMVLALELAHQGVRSILVERRPATTTFPKMDITNARSMELLARLGLADLVRSVGVPAQHSFDVIFASSLAGRAFGRWQLPSAEEMRAEIARCADGSMPAEPWLRASQAKVEAVLMERCLLDDLIDVQRPWQVTGVAQDADFVETTIAHAELGDHRVLRSAYVVGCDGARSRVRESLGVTQDGVEAVATFALVHFRSRDRERLQAHGQYWHLFFAGGGVVISQDEDEIWTLHSMIAPDTDPRSVDPVAVIHDVCGVPVEVDGVFESTVWKPNVLVADSYRAGRVFLAGDACHQVVPTGGYGMNTGVADAVDLGWKLAAVLDGWGGEALLDSYEAERRPVALRNRDWSFRNLSVHLQTWERADVALIDQDSEAGARHRTELGDFLAANNGENTSTGIELGYSYAGSPVVAADGEPPDLDPFHYTPTTLPGARAPHVALPDGRSILAEFSRVFTLVDHGATGAERVLEAAAARGIPIRRVALDPHAPSAPIYERRLVLVRPDGHVAWRGDDLPDDCDALIAHVAGHGAALAATPATHTEMVQL